MSNAINDNLLPPSVEFNPNHILWRLKFVETVVKIDDDGLEGNQKLGMVVSEGQL